MKDTFTFDEVTVYHVTTRLQKERLGEFKIDNLEEELIFDGIDPSISDQEKT